MGLPRLTDRHEYTAEEIAKADLSFSLYRVMHDRGMQKHSHRRRHQKMRRQLKEDIRLVVRNLLANKDYEKAGRLILVLRRKLTRHLPGGEVRT